METAYDQRSFCTDLCPRRDTPEVACSLCRVLDERNRFEDWLWLELPRSACQYTLLVLWWLWELSGLRSICAKIIPTWKAASEPRPSTFCLWVVGIYAALFVIALQRYENHIDRIEAHANNIYAQLGSIKWKQAIERIPRAQAMTRPKQPYLFKPWSVMCSLYFCEQTRDAATVQVLKEVISAFKDDLAQVNLDKADLRGANLRQADLREVNLRGANLGRAELHGANLQGADLRQANLSRANLVLADLDDANLVEANLSGATHVNAFLPRSNLVEANLRGADLFDCGLT